MTGQITAAEWVEAIAKKAKLPAVTVQEVLDRHGVEPQSTLPRRKSLRLRSITVRGVKGSSAGSKPFDRTFAFGPGLWAILSDQNFRGKSTLLNIIQGGIRGDLADRVKPDVWSWLSFVEVVFEANGIGYRLRLAKEAGQQEKEAAASFSREEESGWLSLFEGDVGKPLERAVEDAMLAEFGFPRFHAHNERDGSHSHGWPVIASALFVNGPGKAVFGEVLFDAIPLRLLQMFMGLPWVSTFTSASTALKRLRPAKVGHRAPNKGLKTRLQDRRAEVEASLKSAMERVQPGRDRGAMRSRILEEDARVLALRAGVEETRRAAFEISRQLQGATTVLADTRRALQQLKDDRAAGVVLRTLRPVCCPSCDTGIDGDKHARAAETDTCALCGTRHVEGGDEEGMRLEELEADVTAVAANVAELTTALQEEQAAERKAGEDLADAVRVARELEREMAVGGEAELELEIRGLEAQRDQLVALIVAEDEEDGNVDAETGDDDEAVLKAAEVVTKALYDDLAREILVDVSAEITRLSREFGVQNIESMDWGTGGAMRIVQGGAPTSFGALSPGENLRVRIAAALAVIEVARKRMYGRHPGLLVLDSPAAQEMSPEDFAALLSSIQKAVENAADIQIVVGAVAKPAILDVVSCDHVTHAQGEQFLF
jgi:hypothetical protein